MALLEGTPAPTARARAERSVADRRATWIAGLAACLTLAAILGLPGPSAWFMGFAPVVGLLACGAALIGAYMERFRAGWTRVLLTASSIALIAGGIWWVRSASGVRVVVAYFAPAALFLVAAGALHAPRLRERAT
jgi:hypothetical protein